MIELDDGSLVQKAAAYRITFGHGTDKSNDRLKRVRGIGRAKMEPALEAIAEGSDERDDDMEPVVQPLDVVIVTAKMEGDCESACICQIQELKHGGTIENDLTMTELRESSTKVAVRLAQVQEDGGALWYNGSVVSSMVLKNVDGSDVPPTCLGATCATKLRAAPRAVNHAKSRRSGFLWWFLLAVGGYSRGFSPDGEATREVSHRTERLLERFNLSV